MDQLLDQVAGVGETQRIGRPGEIPAAPDRHARRGFQAEIGMKADEDRGNQVGDALAEGFR